MSAELNGATGRDLRYAAAFLGLSPHTVRALVRRKALAHYRLGRRLIFKEPDLEAFLRRHRVEARGDDRAVIGIPFGRYRGRSLGELPDAYLEWLPGLNDLREPLRSAVEAEWRARLRSQGAALVPLPREAVPVADELVTAGYRALVRRYHPDAGGNHGAMVLINRAVACLRQAVQRSDAA